MKEEEQEICHCAEFRVLRRVRRILRTPEGEMIENHAAAIMQAAGFLSGINDAVQFNAAETKACIQEGGMKPKLLHSPKKRLSAGPLVIFGTPPPKTKWMDPRSGGVYVGLAVWLRSERRWILGDVVHELNAGRGGKWVAAGPSTRHKTFKDACAASTKWVLERFDTGGEWSPPYVPGGAPE